MTKPAPSLLEDDQHPTADLRRAGPGHLSLALMDARNHTLSLLTHHEQAGEAPAQATPGLDPPLWLAGHIGWFAEYWIGRNPQRALGARCPADTLRLASVEPNADPWWNPALAPPGQRLAPQGLDASAVRAWLRDTLESTLELLDKAGDSDDALYFYRLALFHEDLRGEQLITMAQTLGLPLQLALPVAAQPREPVHVPATRWLLGVPAGGFAFDIEREAHEVQVPEFEIDAQPVTWAQVVEFVDDCGYDRAELWQPEGWEWLQRLAMREGRRGPRHVEQIGVASGAVMQTLFGRAVRMSGSQPAMHLSWWEADAWCRWAGRRLPTEVEWEIAAHRAVRQGFRWGDVHEWTASTLRPWPGFQADPWTALADWSGPHWLGRARVQRGGSFATRARMKHPRYRGFAAPERDDRFVGFRSCAF